MFLLQKHFLCFNIIGEPTFNLGNFPDVTDSREKRNQGQSDFLKQKIW
jgi:hypothetical protein